MSAYGLDIRPLIDILRHDGFTSKEAWVTLILCGSEQEWTRFPRSQGGASLAADPRFPDWEHPCEQQKDTGEDRAGAALTQVMGGAREA